MLFFALLVIVAERARGTKVESYNKWAKSVLDSEGARYDELGDMYTLPISQEWKFSGPLFKPLKHAYNGTWHAQDLERIGVAMQAWRGDVVMPTSSMRAVSSVIGSRSHARPR